MINLFGASQNSYGSVNRCNNSFAFVNSLQKEQKQKLKDEQYNDIFEHEKAHKDAAGDLAGPIVIENNAQGIPVKGHVDIKMPVLNEENPDETIEHADTVIKSAMAPDDPSGQDYKVAGEAKTIKSQAENLKNKPNNENQILFQPGRNLNFIA